jgi:CheY-like chemotaxis protein
MNPMPAQLLKQPCAKPAGQSLQQQILIVDDDAPRVEILSQRLKQQGFGILTACTGAEALLVARESHPCLILMDFRLPDTNGWEVCSQLAEARETCHIPVIILSGMERPDIIRRSRGAGCQYFVRKPFDPGALQILIQQAIAEASHAQPA